MTSNRTPAVTSVAAPGESSAPHGVMPPEIWPPGIRELLGPPPLTAAQVGAREPARADLITAKALIEQADELLKLGVYERKARSRRKTAFRALCGDFGETNPSRPFGGRAPAQASACTPSKPLQVNGSRRLVDAGEKWRARNDSNVRPSDS